MSSTSSREVCPPETSNATQGVGNRPCSSRSTATCPARWLTPYSGLSSATAKALAAASPTTSAPIRPGPAVTATPSISHRSTSAISHARRRVGTIASRCARLATSGTTPPNRMCWSTLEATSLASSSVPRTIPIPVSSQDDSIPRTRGPFAFTTGVLSRLELTLGPAGQLPELEDQGVPPLAVVVLPGRQLLEPELLVRGDGRLVVVRDLQQHRSGAGVAHCQQSGADEGAADAGTAMMSRHDQPVQVCAAVNGLQRDHAHRMVGTRDQDGPPLSEQLAEPAALAPLLLGVETLPLERHDRVEVVAPGRQDVDLGRTHAGRRPRSGRRSRTDLRLVDTAASGRRRYSGVLPASGSPGPRTARLRGSTRRGPVADRARAG